MMTAVMNMVSPAHIIALQRGQLPDACVGAAFRDAEADGVKGLRIMELRKSLRRQIT
ncbi:MAG: hypothetical protein U9N43_05400 [Euryarchaeota archaeon]|nr:hypothetical protein [Euryarchaeota archaeon]